VADKTDERIEGQKASIWQAALVTYALEIRAKLGMPTMDPREAVRKMGLRWEEVEAAVPAVKEWLAKESRGPGRPQKAEDDSAAHPGTWAVMTAVRDYLMKNPGAAAAGPGGVRTFYSQGFREFVVTLIGPGGPGEGMTLPQAEYATGVSQRTLTAWRQLMGTRSRQETPK